MRACLPRPPLVTAVLVCLTAVLLLTPDPTRGQEKAAPPAAAATKDVLPLGPALLLPTDPGVAKKLQAVREYVAAKEWEEAVKLLQGCLDMPEDVFLTAQRRGPDGKEITAPVSLRAEVSRLLGELPRPGREAYEALVGPRARQALANAGGQPPALAAVVQRYGHARAGAEAAALLGAHHLDRGHFGLAAGYFDRLLRSPGADQPEPLLLFQAALAFRRAGDRDRAEQTWKRLAAAAPDGVRAGDRTVPLAELEKELNRPAGAAAPLPEAPRQRAAPSEGTARAWVEDAVRRQEAASQPALAASTPVAAGGKVVYRSHRGIAAVDPETGLTAWESPSALALDNLVRDPAAHAHVGAWVEAYLAGQAHVLLENSVLGSLSTDGRRVYAVEDLPVPPRPGSYYAFHANQGQGLSLADTPELTDAVYHSKLLAIDAESGKVVWDLGGRAAPGGGLLRDCYFLGPPLPLGGKLYVPVQKDFDLRLLCLEPLTGAVVWSQTLVTFKARLALDGGRRLHAVRLAYGDSLLVCPTHAGGVVAFDLVGRSLAWAHSYREEPPPPEPPPAWAGRRPPRGRGIYVTEPPNLTSEWKVSAPVIAGDKVVFTAADAPELRCLDLHDGSLTWQAKRGDGDLFLAGAPDGKVLVVGKRQVRAVNLADGTPLWQCDTPAPAGLGAAAGNTYRLPVRGSDGKAEVLAIDLDKGTVTSRTPRPEKAGVGNPVVPERMGPPEPPGGAHLAALVKQLGSNSYAGREAATRALDDAGARALDALRRAVSDNDPEVRRRAAALARAIERRAETEALLAPQRLRLHYQDTPLAEAAADFSKKSGVVLKLPPELTRAAGRKVTLDTGEVTFWKAFDKFCEKAGLAETSSPAPNPGGNTVTTSSIVIRGGGVVRTPTDVLRTAPDDKPLELALGDGKPAPRLGETHLIMQTLGAQGLAPAGVPAGALAQHLAALGVMKSDALAPAPRPTSYAGALRVRPAPPETPAPYHTRADGEALLALDVATEGLLQWQKAVGLRIDKALDEDGRPLAPLPTAFKPPPPAGGAPGVTINGMPITPPTDEPSGPAARLVAVRLKQAGEKPAKKLKELTGTIIAQVRAPREALVTVENVLKSAGRAVKGRQGGEVKVVEAAQLEGGGVRLKVQVEAPSRGLTDAGPNPLNATVIINGKRVGEEELLSSLHFALLDDKGKPFRTVKAMTTGLRAGAAHEYELTYQPEAGQGEAAKFVYTDRRTLFVEVPFALRDVPLP